MRERPRTCRSSDRRRAGGFTLAEVLVTIGLAAVLLTVYSVMLTSTIFLRRSQFNAQASSLLQEELDSLRALPFSELLDRTDGNFLGIILNRGDWSVIGPTGDGQNNRLRLETAASELYDESGLVALPANWQTDFTFSAKIKPLSSSPGGWGTGLVLRYRDAENHYRFRFTSGGLAFDKVQYGTVSTLWTSSATMNTDTWYTLEVVASADSFTLKKDGSTIGTVNDATFTIGEQGLASFDGAMVEFDDVSLTVDAATTEWNFEVNDTGTYPEDWRRIGWPDLPGGNGTLTIADYESESTLKQVTATISWEESGRTRTVTGSTVIHD